MKEKKKQRDQYGGHGNKYRQGIRNICGWRVEKRKQYGRCANYRIGTYWVWEVWEEGRV